MYSEEQPRRRAPRSQDALSHVRRRPFPEEPRTCSLAAAPAAPAAVTFSSVDTVHFVMGLSVLPTHALSFFFFFFW